MRPAGRRCEALAHSPGAHPPRRVSRRAPLARRRIAQALRGRVENLDGFSRAQLRAAYDTAASCRATFDRVAAHCDAVLTPSTKGEARAGLVATGSYAFNALWSVLHVPCINLPGFVDASGLPVGLSLVEPRFSDHDLLAVAASLGAAAPAHHAGAASAARRAYQLAASHRPWRTVWVGS